MDLPLTFLAPLGVVPKREPRGTRIRTCPRSPAPWAVPRRRRTMPSPRCSGTEDAQRGGSQRYSTGLRDELLRMQQESGTRAQLLAFRSVSARAMVSIALQALLSRSLRSKCWSWNWIPSPSHRSGRPTPGVRSLRGLHVNSLNLRLCVC